MKERLRGVPARLRVLQVGGAWVGGALFGSNLLAAPIAMLSFGSTIDVTPFLLIPIGIFIQTWSFRLDAAPIRLGVCTCLLVTGLAIPYGIVLLSAPYLPSEAQQQIAAQGAVIAGVLWLALVHLASLRMYFRYSAARVEFPEAIDSLWRPSELARTRELLRGARWQAILVGFVLSLLLRLLAASTML